MTASTSVTSLVRRETTSPVRVALEEGRRQPQDVAVDPGAQVGGEARADPVDVVDAHPRHRPQHDDQPGERREPGVEQVGAAAGEPLVDHALQALADHEDHGGGDEQRDEGERRCAAGRARAAGRAAAAARTARPRGARRPASRRSSRRFSRRGAGSASPPCPRPRIAPRSCAMLERISTESLPESAPLAAMSIVAAAAQHAALQVEVAIGHAPVGRAELAGELGELGHARPPGRVRRLHRGHEVGVGDGAVGERGTCPAPRGAARSAASVADSATRR